MASGIRFGVIQLKLSKNMNINVQEALRKMGVEYNEREVNTEGWITISAPYRQDKNPSMGLNIENGSYVDHGIGERGSIVDLVKKTMKLSGSEAHKFIYGENNCRNKAIQSSKTFWDDQKDTWLKGCQDHLSNKSAANILQIVDKYDGLNNDTLKKFKCGIVNRYSQDWLVIPYETGAQLYTRDEKGKKISMEKGSKPKDSFFGTDQIKGNKKLIIAKSPREAMLYWQELGETFDVISITSGEVAKISNAQKLFLKNHLTKVNKVYISFDRDTKQAEDIAFGFARAVRDIDNNYGLDIELLNISKLTEDRYKDFTDLVKSELKNKIGELFALDYNYSDYVWNTITEENKIWQLDDAGKITLDPIRLTDVLHKYGYAKIYYKESTEPILIKRSDNVLSQPSGHQLNDFIKEQLINKYSKYIDKATIKNVVKYKPKAIINKLYYPHSKQVIRPDYKVHMTRREVKFLTDTKDTSFLYFSDKVAKVTKNSVEEIKYSDLDGVIWENQIIKRPFSYQNSSGKDSVFAKFVSNISNKDDKRIASLESHIGYYLHSYKKASNTKAAIFTDERMGAKGSANGGTGKSLVGRAIQKMRKVTFIGGKQFDPSNRFAFMDVEVGDQLVIIDDVKEDFNFESLFTVITNDMNIEAKGANRYTIPFEYSPKILITSNTPLEGSGNSHKRRQSIVEFADYYTPSFTPESEFGHSFFDEWETKEWNRFHNYMIHCLQVYLTSGLVSYSINYERKQIGLLTSPEFVEWAEKYLEVNLEYDSRELFRGNCSLFNTAKAVGSPKDRNHKEFSSFGKLYPDILDINKKARTFNTWLYKFGEFKGWHLDGHHNNGNKMISFKKN